MKQVKKLPLTKDCHHWRRLGEVPWDLQKQIANDIDGAFPQPSSSSSSPSQNESAGEGGASDGRTTIVDLFAGAGANAISFALQPHPTDAGRRRWDRVVAVERDPATLACAQHNAALHGLSSGAEASIVWVLGDSFEFLKEATGATTAASRPAVHNGGKMPPPPSSSSPPPPSSSDVGGSDSDDEEEEDYSIGSDLKLDPATTVLFASPPWGGPGYSTDAVFDLNTMEPYNLAKLHGAYRAMDHALYLPRTSDLRQIARLAPTVPLNEEEAAGDGGGGVDSDSDGEGYSAGQIRPQRQEEHDQNKKRKTSNRTKIEVVQYCVEGASKALVAYIPASTVPRRQADDNDVDVNMEGNGT
ncbi:putative diacylglycerol O-acyltransferase tgs1 [Diatrype stigma]|uniref:Trimethylguanosine synthase n=1 Tax=Diatrype stigma TaxID=117547 RepID=A0AAN9UAZ0_9PEZI